MNPFGSSDFLTPYSRRLRKHKSWSLEPQSMLGSRFAKSKTRILAWDHFPLFCVFVLFLFPLASTCLCHARNAKLERFDMISAASAARLFPSHVVAAVRHKINCPCHAPSKGKTRSRGLESVGGLPRRSKTHEQGDGQLFDAQERSEKSSAKCKRHQERSGRWSDVLNPAHPFKRHSSNSSLPPARGQLLRSDAAGGGFDA